MMGDSRVGKTEFAVLATTGHVPLNVYASTQLEVFQLRGTCTVADIVVVPGKADNAMLAEATEGATGIIVLYTNSIYSARRWLVRVPGSERVPILICSHNNRMPPDRRVRDTLGLYITAEHTCTSSLLVTGMKDCVNRIVCRARKDIPSPL